MQFLVTVSYRFHQRLQGTHRVTRHEGERTPEDVMSHAEVTRTYDNVSWDPVCRKVRDCP